MPFTRILKDLTGSMGARGAIMLDHDGEMVASYCEHPGTEIDLVGAHHAIIFNIIKDISAATKPVNGIKNAVITTSGGRLAVCSIKEGYCLVVAMDRSVNEGKAVFESNRAILRLEEEMG